MMNEINEIAFSNNWEVSSNSFLKEHGCNSVEPEYNLFSDNYSWQSSALIEPLSRQLDYLELLKPSPFNFSVFPEKDNHRKITSFEPQDSHIVNIDAVKSLQPTGENFQTKLFEAIELTKHELSQFILNSDFEAKIHSAFGDNYKNNEAISLIENIILGKQIPEIKLVSNPELNTEGLFDGNNIYLAKELFDGVTSNQSTIVAVLLEELGHYLDSQLNQVDSPGDEGEIFAAFVRGKQLSQEELETLKAEDDTATIELNGRLIQVEQSDYALQLDTGDSITHNRFVVPDIAETLTFDMMVTQENDDDVVEADLEQDGEWIKLGEAELDVSVVDDSEEFNEIETYHWDVPQELIGKVSRLQFSVVDKNNDNSNATVLLDNIFFTDEVEIVNLGLITGDGNPTDEVALATASEAVNNSSLSDNYLDLTWDAPETGTKQVEIKIDGEFERFLQIDYQGAEDLNPARDIYQFKLVAGGDSFTFQANPLAYDKMYFGTYPNKQPKKYQDLDRDRLYGAEFIVSEFTPDQDAIRVDTTSYLSYRWLNVIDPEARTDRSIPLSDQVDDTALFHRTLADGEGNFVREKQIDLRLPRSVKTAFVSENTQSNNEFEYSEPRGGRGIVQWNFDPVDASNQQNCYFIGNYLRKNDAGQNVEEAAYVPCKTDLVNIVAQFENNQTVNIGNLQVRGHATEPATIYLNLDGFKNELFRILDNGKLGDTEDETLDGLIQEPNDTSKIEYRTKNNLDPTHNPKMYPFVISNKFKDTFADFLPIKRQEAINNNNLAEWQTQLNTFIDEQATLLLAAVQEDFAPANQNGIMGFTIVPDSLPAGTSTGIPVSWYDVIRTSTEKTAYPEPIDGKSFYNRTDGYKSESVIKNILENENISKPAKEWAMAEGLNAVNLSSVLYAHINVANHFCWIGTDNLSFAGAVANTVSQELGHNFGLTDAYLGKNNVAPLDIMGKSDPSYSNLEFDPRNLTLLQAALGFYTSPYSDKIERPFFRFNQKSNNALVMYMNNWNLPNLPNGLNTSSYLLKEEDI